MKTPNATGNKTRGRRSNASAATPAPIDTTNTAPARRGRRAAAPIAQAAPAPAPAAMEQAGAAFNATKSNKALIQGFKAQISTAAKLGAQLAKSRAQLDQSIEMNREWVQGLETQKKQLENA